MYLQFFGLREYPFSLTPDTGFFFEYGHFREALNTLLVALRSGEGFVKVTGEVGTGKTILCRKLLASIGEGFETAYVPNPYLTPNALSLALAEELGLKLARNSGQHSITKELTRRLIDLSHQGKQVVLCIDEAQAMPRETLEALRLLTNLETEKRKLLQVVLFGQPELDQRLRDRSVRQLRQRITFSYQLVPVDQQGMAAYVNHRLLVAGSSGAAVQFEPAAMGRMFRASRGIPRLVNILAHKALMAAYGQGSKAVTAGHVDSAVADTLDATGRTWWLWLAAGVSVAAIAGLAFWWSVTGALIS